MKSKADLVAALKGGVDYCNKAYISVTDKSAGEVAKLFGRDRSKAGILSFNTGHTFEHYGNVVTYMRIRGLVPPSSEGR